MSGYKYFNYLLDYANYMLIKNGRGSRDRRLGAHPPLGRRFAIQNALFNSIQAPICPGRPPVEEILYPPLKKNIYIADYFNMYKYM